MKNFLLVEKDFISNKSTLWVILGGKASCRQQKGGNYTRYNTKKNEKESPDLKKNVKIVSEILLVEWNHL